LKLGSNKENIYGHLLFSKLTYNYIKERCPRDRMIVKFTTAYAIIAYHHWCFEFEVRSCRGILDTVLCEEVYQWLTTSRCFFCHDI